MGTIEDILDRLECVRKAGHGYMARCPNHNDNSPSLSICEGRDSRILVHCFAGCETKDVLAKLDLTTAALMPSGDGRTDTDTMRVLAPPRRVVSVSETSREFDTRESAVAALVARHGSCSHQWQYVDATGAVVGSVLRWDQGNRKTYRPVSRHGGVWRHAGMPDPRPLYQLPAILAMDQSQTVWINEGEKACDACAALGLLATASAHGARSARKTDWSPLAGRKVVIIRDNDEAGITYAAAVSGCLEKLLVRPRVVTIALPGVPAHGDIVDYIDAQRLAGRSISEIRNQVERLAMQAIDAPKRVPGKTLRKWKPFPIDSMPAVVSEFVVAHSLAMNCDPCFIALPLIASLATCVGMTRCAAPKQSWKEPCILWTAIVTPSGTLKTPSLRAALATLRRAQRRELDIHESVLQTYNEDQAQYERQYSAWRRGDDDSTAPEKPKPPAPVRYVVNDATVEALAPILEANPRGVLMERDELAGWIGDLDRYSHARGGDVARWLSAWSGEQMIIDRKSGGTTFVPHAAVSVTGTIQPAVLSRVLGSALRENGLAARLLMAMPPRRAASWSDADVEPRIRLALGDVVDRLLALEFAKDVDGRPCSIDVPLKPEARSLFTEWYDRHEREVAEESGDIAAALSKMRGYALRLALLLQMVRAASNEAVSDAIDHHSMRSALVLVEWFKGEARRVYETLDLPAEERLLRQQVEIIERKGGSVTVREWQRSRSLPTSEVAGAQLRALEQAGYGTLTSAPQQGPGHPSTVFTLAPPNTSDTDSTPADESESQIVSVSEQSAAPDSASVDWGEL